MNSKGAKAFSALREIEEMLGVQLSRRERAKQRMDTPFVRAVAEVHTVLSAGLNAVESRLLRGRPLKEDSSPKARSRAAAEDAGKGKPWAPEPALSDDEFLIDYALELGSLTRERRIAPKFAPRGLRMKSPARGPGAPESESQ
jgi:hypothetical protein